MADPPVLHVDPLHPEADIVERVRRVLLRGKVVAAPSDTVYGLLIRSRDEAARERLQEIKGREGPFLLLVSSWGQAKACTEGVSGSVWERLRRIWPGPVTVLLPARADVPGGQSGAIGLRMPRNPFLLAVLRATGEPLFSTSANPPGGPPPLDARAVDASVRRRVALVVDGGPAGSNRPSTLVDLRESDPRVLREGAGDAGPLLDPDLGAS